MDRCRSCGSEIPSHSLACPRCGGTAAAGPNLGGARFSAGRVLDGRFKIERFLGAGSAGAVYEVTDLEAGERAALKILWDAAEERPEPLERLRREVLAAQAAKNPRLLAVRDLLTVEGRPALLMELVEGTSLKERIAASGGLSPEEAAKVTAEVARALASLHEAGIVHRDVKSANILMPREGGVKLGDLGLAKGAEIGATLTATGATLGTPGYMAPEVIRGEGATFASDLYSLGVVLFEMVAGKLPFDGSSGLHVAHKHLSMAPPVGNLRQKGTPAWLVGICSRLLEKEPEARYASALELAAALENRKAADFRYRLSRIFRKHWPKMAAAAALAAGIAVALVLWPSGQASPLRLSFHDKVLEAKAPDGRLAWTRELPRAIQSACFGNFGPGGGPAAACAVEWDSNASGVELNDDSRCSIWIFDAKGGGMERTPIPILDRQVSRNYIAKLSSHRFKAGEPERLVAYVRHATWHPTGLFVYSFSKGEPWKIEHLPDAQFLNSGAIRGWAFMDLDGDGRDDIFCAGVNMAAFWAGFVSGVKVGPPGVALPIATSPDQNSADGGAPLFYRFFSFAPYTQLDLRGGKNGETLLRFGNGLPWRVGAAGELARQGWRDVTPSDAALFTARINRLSYLRDGRNWEELFSESQRLPETPSGVYTWLKRLYRAAALEGLGRYAEAAAAAAGRGEEEIPPYAYQIELDSRFLEGRYGQVARLYDAVPDEVRQVKVELGNTLFLSLFCEGGGTRLAQAKLSNHLYAYDWYPAMLLAARDCLEGRAADGERAIRRMGKEIDQEPGPRLWLAQCLLSQGKTREAQQALNEAERLQDGESRELMEAKLWVAWRAGEKDPACLARFEALVKDARAESLISPRARAFLPVTLARYAAILRGSKRNAEARAALDEALRLAPKGWDGVLKSWQ